MKKILTAIIFLLGLHPLQSALGASSEYRLLPLGADSNNNKFNFSIKYTIGTHHGKALEGEGQVTFDPENWGSLRGEFQIPIEALKTGDAKRDCHMMEALGLNYELSEFPEQHVCDSRNNLPSSGNNSIKYPHIRFVIEEGELLQGSLTSGREARVRVHGFWKIHGREKSASHDMDLKWDSEDQRILKAKTSLVLNLKDHDVQVKPARVLGLTIKTSNFVNLFLDMSLKRVN